MSVYLTAAQVQQFDSEVKHAYANAGLLRKAVRVKTGVVGYQHRFPKMGKGIATPRIPQTDVVPMNIAHTNATATLTDWNAPEYTDIFNQQKVNYSEREQLAQIIAGAIGRREDQLIINALDSATLAAGNQIDENTGGTDTNLNTAKMRAAKRVLDVQGAPMGERWALIHANCLFGLLGDSDATTFDRNAIKALVDGEITKWLGFNIISVEDRSEGGLPYASNEYECFFFHGGSSGSVGLAVGLDFKTEVNYIAEKTSWLANGLYCAGAIDIDVNGIVEVECYY
jgi:hypothetical protein